MDQRKTNKVCVKNRKIYRSQYYTRKYLVQFDRTV